MSHKENLWFYVNGKKVVVEDPSPEISLLQFLRTNLRLTGSKNGCGQGGCGACTVMVSSYHGGTKRTSHRTVNSCITPVCTVYGLAVTTVEGIGNTKTGLHPLQESLVKNHGIQCGFCTPGMVVTLFCLLRNNNQPTQIDVERALEGNLCRCTGYRPILDSVKPFTVPDSQAGQYVPCDMTQNVIFPPELMKPVQETTKIFRHGDWTWILPFTLEELCKVKESYPGSKVVMGTTSISYLLHMNKLETHTLIYGCRVKELQEIRLAGGHLEIGSAVTMTNLEEFLKSMDDPKPSSVRAILRCVRWLAAEQIRNVATIGGHVVTADNRSDLNPLLVSLRASLVVMRDGQELQIPVDNNFFIGRFKTILTQKDLLVRVIVPDLLKTNTYTEFYKQSERKGFDYAIANAACSVTTSSEGTVDSAVICVGGISDKPVLLPEVSKALIGSDRKSLDIYGVVKAAADEVSSICKDEYKRSLVCGFVSKFLSSLTEEKELIINLQDPPHWLKPCQSTQVFEDVPSSQSEMDTVGRPLPLLTAHSLVSGEAQFVDDIPRFKDELYLSPVYSTKAHAKILNVDTSTALQMSEVIGYYDHTKVIGQNKFGILVPDEELFASEMVHCYGQTIGVIAATSEMAARKAAQTIRVKYEELTPILSIEDAIAQNSFYTFTSSPIHKGDIDKGLTEAEIVLEGEVRTGHQEHHYMEPITVLAIPKEDREIEVFLTGQNSMFQQRAISALLGIPKNRITIIHRRAGGAFGGKEVMPFHAAGPAALVAQLTGRPVRYIMERHIDMIRTGKRHPYLIRYKVGCDREGNILAADFNLFSNAGYSLDLSPAIMDTSLLTIDGGYNIPHFRVKGHVCRTNTPSNTAFRGFGAPQALVGMETMMYHVAKEVGKTQEEVRRKHLYQEKDLTIYKMVLENCNIQKCWEECERQSRLMETRDEVMKFNGKNSTLKRGIAMMPIKFPIGFSYAFMNQGNALLSVYMDGTVLLTHGGCEIGQGLNTKMIQVASRCLGIPVDKIYTRVNTTDVTPNATATVASTTSDIIGAAVVNGCTELMQRLKPLRNEHPDISWENLVTKAYMNRVNLSVIGHARTGGGPYDAQKGVGRPCNYFTYGAGCCVVEIDCLTGDHQVLSMDIVMDVGKSLNPAIDIGQIEGGFIQGYGMITIEDLKSTPDGIQISNGPINYKIPGVRNIPREFQVSLLKDCPNTKAVYSSKGIGEPPLLLSISVYLALKEAIAAARKGQGHSEKFHLDCPVTAERIRMACLN